LIRSTLRTKRSSSSQRRNLAARAKDLNQEGRGQARPRGVLLPRARSSTRKLQLHKLNLLARVFPSKRDNGMKKPSRVRFNTRRRAKKQIR